MNSKLFGEQLKKFRRQRKVNAYQISDAIGTKKSTYYRWEKGETTPNVVYLWRLCDYYNVDPTTFLYWTPPEELVNDGRGPSPF